MLIGIIFTFPIRPVPKIFVPYNDKIRMHHKVMTRQYFRQIYHFWSVKRIWDNPIGIRIVFSKPETKKLLLTEIILG
mgnify:CR=1 FL=1